MSNTTESAGGWDTGRKRGPKQSNETRTRCGVEPWPHRNTSEKPKRRSVLRRSHMRT